MPSGLERRHGGHDLHFITFSCYRSQPLLATAQRRDLFLEVLERVRRRYRWGVLAYVVMPEHVHLLVSEPAERPLSTAVQALKLGFARRVIGERRRQHPSALIECGPQRIWQARYCDFNACTAEKRVEKLRYMHRNFRGPQPAPVLRWVGRKPVKRGWSRRPTYGAGGAFARMPIRRRVRWD
jgi:REP-associated tyrosine transposase